jgi:hypothetical protein
MLHEWRFSPFAEATAKPDAAEIRPAGCCSTDSVHLVTKDQDITLSVVIFVDEKESVCFFVKKSNCHFTTSIAV